MCIIVSKPAGIVLPPSVIQECFSWNDDGAGFCFIDKGRIMVQKGYFNVRKLIKDLTVHAEKEMVIHFRRKSHGEISVKNCHPFRFACDEFPHYSFALAHNGVLPWRSTATESDTMCFVKDVMQPHLSGDPYFLDRPTGMLMLKRFIGDKNKFVVMRYNSKTNESKIYIVNEEAGVKDLGCWFSNTTYVKVADVVVGTVAFQDNWRRFPSDDYEIGNWTLLETGDWRKSYLPKAAETPFDKVMRKVGRDKVTAIGANYGNNANYHNYGHGDGSEDIYDTEAKAAAEKRLALASQANDSKEDSPTEGLVDADAYHLNHLGKTQKTALRRIAADFTRAQLGADECLSFNPAEMITYLREHCREEIPVLSQLTGPAIDRWILEAGDRGELNEILYGPTVSDGAL